MLASQEGLGSMALVLEHLDNCHFYGLLSSCIYLRFVFFPLQLCPLILLPIHMTILSRVTECILFAYILYQKFLMSTVYHFSLPASLPSQKIKSAGAPKILVTIYQNSGCHPRSL
jgi:hypothetical protein